MTGTKANRVQNSPPRTSLPTKSFSRRRMEPISCRKQTAKVASACNGWKTGCCGASFSASQRKRRACGRVGPIAVLGRRIGMARRMATSAEISPKKVEDSLVWSFGFKQMPRGTQKVRWVFADAKQPIVLKGISAYTRSRCEHDGRPHRARITRSDGRPTSTYSANCAKAEIDVYNGDLSSIRTGEVSLPLHVGHVEAALAESPLQRSAALQGRSDRVAVR